MPFPRFRTFADLTEPEPPQITGDFAPEGLDPSAWDYIKRGGIQTLGRAGDILDRSGNAIRGLLAGETAPLRSILSRDNLLFADDERHVSGRDLVDKWLGTQNVEGFHPIRNPGDALLDVLGFGTEVVTDPLTYTGIGLLTKAGKLARSATTVASLEKNIARGGKAAQRFAQIEQLAKAGDKGATDILGRLAELKQARTTLAMAKESGDLVEQSTAQEALKRAAYRYTLPETLGEQAKLGYRKALGFHATPFSSTAQGGIAGERLLSALGKFGTNLQTAPIVGPGATALRRMFSTSMSREGVKDITDLAKESGKYRVQVAKDKLGEIVQQAEKSGVTQQRMREISDALEQGRQRGPLWQALAPAEKQFGDALAAFHESWRKETGRPELGTGLKLSIEEQKQRLAESIKAQDKTYASMQKLKGKMDVSVGKVSGNIVFDPQKAKFFARYGSGKDINADNPVAQLAHRSVQRGINQLNRAFKHLTQQQADTLAMRTEVTENMRLLGQAQGAVPTYLTHSLTDWGRLFERATDHIPGFDRLAQYSVKDPMAETRHWVSDVLDANGKSIGKIPDSMAVVEKKVRGIADEVLQSADIEKLRGQYPAEVKALEKLAKGEGTYFDHDILKSTLASLERGGKSLRNRELAAVMGRRYGIKTDEVDALRKLGMTDASAKTRVSEIEAGYELGRGELWKDYYFPRDISAELAQMDGKFNSPEWAGGLLKQMNAVNHLYKSMFTVFFPQFHMRNSWSNVFLNALGGVMSPMAYVRAAEYMMYEASGGKFGNAVKIAGYDQKRLKNLMRKMGVEASDWFSSEFEDTEKLFAQFGPTRKYLGLEQKARKVSSKVESYARIAHFFGKLEKGFTPEAAAKSVKKYLFDYGDLTDFEKKYMRSTVLFYTFMRKNAGLQLQMMLEKPGIYSAYGRLYAANMDPNAPDYEREGLNLEIAQRRIGQFGTPIDEFFSHIVSEPTRAETMKQTLMRFAGGLSPMLKIPVEFTSGTNLFFGQPIQQQTRAPEAYNVPGMAQLLGLERDEKGRLRGDPEALWFMQNLPTSRFARTASQFLEPDVNWGDVALRNLVGSRFQDATAERDVAMIRKRRARELARQYTGEGRVKKLDNYWIPTEDRGQDESAEALLRLLYAR